MQNHKTGRSARQVSMAVRQAACEAAEKSVATSSLSKDGMVSILDNGIGGISLLISERRYLAIR